MDYFGIFVTFCIKIKLILCMFLTFVKMLKLKNKNKENSSIIPFLLVVLETWWCCFSAQLRLKLNKHFTKTYL